MPYKRMARERDAFSVGLAGALIRTRACTRRSFVWLQRLGSQVRQLDLASPATWTVEAPSVAEQ